jgi:hypothetical protein
VLSAAYATCLKNLLQSIQNSKRGIASRASACLRKYCPNASKDNPSSQVISSLIANDKTAQLFNLRPATAPCGWCATTEFGFGEKEGGEGFRKDEISWFSSFFLHFLLFFLLKLFIL